MKYVQLGNSEIKVSQLCVGCMSFGRPSEDFHQWTLNPQETETIIRKALDLGSTFLIPPMYILMAQARNISVRL